jgi:hypothetical protein
MTYSKLTAVLAFGALSFAIATTNASTTQNPSVFTAGPDGPVVPASLIASANEEGIDLLKTDFKPGLHIMPMSATWHTGERAATLKRQIAEQARQGFHIASGDQVPNIAGALRASKNLIPGEKFVGKRYTSLTEIRPRLFADPITIDHTPLATARFIEAGTAGGIQDGLWTGIARYFDVPGVGLVMLEELDYAVTKASVTMIEELINTDVNGHPATAKTAHTTDGRVLVSVGWMTDRMSYSLLLEPAKPDDTEGNQRVLLEIARNLGS